MVYVYYIYYNTLTIHISTLVANIYNSMYSTYSFSVGTQVGAAALYT